MVLMQNAKKCSVILQKNINFDLFLERGAAKTSVEDITSRAKVAKGTFYLYFQDKGAVMQALLGRVSYQLLSNACQKGNR